MPYSDLALANSATHGLFSRETSKPKLEKLIADCLIPFSRLISGLIPDLTLEANQRLLDIGSGGGLPAIPLALACREIEITMVERNQTKAAFLEMALAKLDLNGAVKTIDLLAETQIDPRKGKYDLATMRWVKATDSILKGIFANLSPGASLVYYSALPENLKESPLWQCQTFSYRFSDDSVESRTASIITLP